MSANLWLAPTAPYQSSLDGSMGATDTSFAVVSSTNLQAPSLLVLDRQDGSGNNTYDKMEFVTFTGISSRTITGVTRGLAGYSAKTHNSGALVESYLSVTHWGDLKDFLTIQHVAATGVHSVLDHVRSVTATGISGASGIKGDVVFVPGSNISIYAMSGASGMSYVNFTFPSGGGGLPPMMILGGLASGSNLTPLLLIEDALTLKSVSAFLKSPASGAAMKLDLNNNFTSIFTDQNTRLQIPAGGTYASTASIGTTTLTAGNIISLDVDEISWGSNLTCLLET